MGIELQGDFGKKKAYIGVQLPDEAGEVIVLERAR